MVTEEHMTDIVDNSDFCRICAGKGRLTEVEYRPHRVVVISPCWFCGGHGFRTVKLMEKPNG